MILSMLKIQHVEQYSMLKSQYSMLKAKGIQHVERNTACWKREVSRWNEFITCRNELTACPLLTFKYPACARQVHLPVHAQQAQQWSLKKAPVKECSWSLKNAPVQECSYSLKNAPGPWRMLLVECSCVCASSAPPCACATGTAVVLEECSCERMLLVLEECSRHSSGPWRMLKMSPRNPRNASWGISRQPVAGFTSALCLCRELAQGYWAQPSAERQGMSAPNISSWMQLLPWVARFFLPRLPAEFCRLRSSSCKECVASEQLRYVLGDCSALRPAQKGAWLLTNHRKPRTSTTSPAPRGKVQTHISVDRRQQCRHGIWSPGDRVVIVEGLAGPERSSTDDVEGLAGPKLGRRQTLPAAGLHIVGAGRVRLHSQTESAFNKSLHTDQRRNLYCWHACVRVRASIFHPRKYIGLSPRRPCGSATTELIRPAGAGPSVLAARPTTLLLVFEHLKISNSFFLQARDSNEMNSPNANSTCCICGQHSTCYITFNMLYLWTAFNML